ncbi:hypothetical protein IQ230_04770 [Gloeocapsopsis crepidinum LEGE 06123]|uniref:Uncharacterized protein n=1 Tax=Gloeocapsopsis crepidinum LEGE 06123 TaxID=588587 RepID=A0ABR9UNV0_9CHRO|nr:hypothetical protein [Gloeocapsopsis crepidinum]MBE9189688.1 hypothetical protein [Gloeocapsopsis crepidinum LEGE 06123]
MTTTAITRKNLIYSLLTGLIIGIFIGAPLGWFTHQFFAERRLAEVLICREKNRNQPEAVLQSMCGSRF